MENLTIGAAAVYALLGYAVVFFGIALLMTVVILMSKIFIARDKKAAAEKAAAAAAAPAPEEAPAPPAAPLRFPQQERARKHCLSNHQVCLAAWRQRDLFRHGRRIQTAKE